MLTREQLKVNFISTNNLSAAQVKALPADASFRSYSRLTLDERSYLLMDAPPNHETVQPFVDVAQYLLAIGLSAPQILAIDVENGFLLIEDFGNNVFAKIFAQRPNELDHLSENHIYEQAINALIWLQKADCPKFLPVYDETLLIQEVKLFTQWYLPTIYGQKIEERAEAEFIEIWQKLIPLTQILAPVTVLRDYHAENLIWLDNRVGKNKVGIIDFQDAVIGSPIYDIVSLLEDARRDVPPAIATNIINYYLQHMPHISRKDFLACYAILGAKRNCKIIGFCARKAIRDNNATYLKLLPRVWGYLENDLKHPLLAPLKSWITRATSLQLDNVAFKKMLA
jgi:aminoglycoside/choline kinase family phosphotransferase